MNTPNHSNSADAQRVRLLTFLRHAGHITTLEARRDLDVLHPAQRVLELRNQGVNIVTHWTVQETECGKPHRVAKYVLGAAKQAEAA